MEKLFKSISHPHLGFVVSLILFFSLPPLGLCEDSHSAEKIETIESAVIKDKGDYGILISGQRYRVTESTLIFDLLGKEIPICDLPVPCEARVEYKSVKGKNPVCLRIEMRRLLEGSKDKE